MIMKKLIFTLATVMVSLMSVYAQDVITTTDNQIKVVYIVEKTDREIKYRMANEMHATLFVTKLSKIKKIEYQNGTVDLLGYQNIRMQKNMGITTGLSLSNYDSDMITASIDYFLNPAICVELNVGTDRWDNYYSVGAKFYKASANKTNSFAPYIGLLYGKEYFSNFLEVPIGINYTAKCGFQTSFQVSMLDHINARFQAVHTELRLGWRF